MDIDKLSLNQKNILELFNKEQFLSVGKVAKMLHIPHPTAKQSLSRLMSYKMVGRQGIGKGTYYHRLDENVITDTFGNEMVKVYRGKVAFSGLFNNIAESLTDKDFYWSFAFQEEYFDAEMRQFFINFHTNLTQKNVADKTIAHKSVSSQVEETYKNVPNLQKKYTIHEVPLGTSIMQDKIINLVWGKEPVAVVIYLPQIVKRYQDFFSSEWKENKD